MEIFISKRLCGQFENHTSVRAHDRFGVFPVAAEFGEVPAASGQACCLPKSFISE